MKVIAKRNIWLSDIMYLDLMGNQEDYIYIEKGEEGVYTGPGLDSKNFTFVLFDSQDTTLSYPNHLLKIIHD